MISREELDELIEGYALDDIGHDIALDLRKALRRIEELETDLLIAHSYADKLVNLIKGDFLPKDIEILRTANAKFAEENFELKTFIKNIADQLKLWNHATALRMIWDAYNKYKLEDL